MCDRLNRICRQAYLITHREDTRPLRKALNQQGFAVTAIRSSYSPRERTFASSERVLINHAKAWQAIARSGCHGLVLEADFVPVRGFGQLLLPVPRGRLKTSIAYLYGVGVEFWDLAEHPSVMRGHAGGMVAYAIAAEVAASLLSFVSTHRRQNPDGHYSCWDSKLGYWLKERGIESYLPLRQYGEHGGVGNPEHAAAGLRATDHADALSGPLCFLPAYAQGSTLRFLWTRWLARLWGWGRLLAGRTLTVHNLLRSNPVAMARFAVGRLLTPPRLAHLSLRG